MLVIKDLYSDISDCFWLFYGSKYNAQMKMMKSTFFEFIVALLDYYCVSLLSFKEDIFKISSFPLFIKPLSPNQFL